MEPAVESELPVEQNFKEQPQEKEVEEEEEAKEATEQRAEDKEERDVKEEAVREEDEQVHMGRKRSGWRAGQEETCPSGDNGVPPLLVCRQPGVAGGELLQEAEPVPVDADDVERAKRLEELRQRNTQFWRKMFVESGVREEEPKAEGNVWKQRLTIAAVIMVVAAGISQALYRAYVDVHFGFKYIDVKDTERLKEVMFGGHPWIVLCLWPERKSNVPEILNSHRRELMRFGNLGRVDCSGYVGTEKCQSLTVRGYSNCNATSQPFESLYVYTHAAELPSGKTFSERFRIPSSTDAIVVTNGKTPRALNAWTFKTWENLSFFLQKSIRVDVTKVEDNIHFIKACLYPPGCRCIAFFRKGGFSAEGRKSISSALAQKGPTRKLKAVTIDSGKYQIAGADIPSEPVYATRVACFGNVSPSPPPETKRTTDVSNNIFIFSLYEGEFTDTAALSGFAEKCIYSKEGAEGFSVLPLAPALKRKPALSSSAVS